MPSFFEFREQMTAKAKTPAPARTTRAPKTDEALSVSALTRQIDSAIRTGLPDRLLVQGELSNTKAHFASGHLYFTLKDDSATINCVMWKSDAARLKFKPADGVEVIAGGSIKVFAQKGAYQLYATTLHPLGQGALEIAFQQMRAKLEAEGLFDPGRKRPLPAFPIRIALVTGQNTAALADMLKVLGNYPWLKITVADVPVQGDGAGKKIAAAIDALSRNVRPGGIEAILLARGGGSLEDRWAFNEEAVARAIFTSKIPIITGIGHEVDVSIADLVADYHAHTPTEAAQVIVGQWRIARDAVAQIDHRLRRAIVERLRNTRQRLLAVERHETFRRPFERINQLRELLDERERSLTYTAQDRIHRHRQRLTALAERLDHHRPVAIVARQREQLTALAKRLDSVITTRLRNLNHKLATESDRLRDRHPRHALRLHHQQLQTIQTRLARALHSQHRRRLDRLSALAAHLKAVGPEQVLQRGYSITTLKKGGAILRDPSQVAPGDKLQTRLATGTIQSTADDPKQPGLFD